MKRKQKQYEGGKENEGQRGTKTAASRDLTKSTALRTVYHQTNSPPEGKEDTSV